MLTEISRLTQSAFENILMKNSLEKLTVGGEMTHAVISMAEFWENADLNELKDKAVVCGFLRDYG